MQFSNSFEKFLPKITDKNFKSCALDLFNYQAVNNIVYHEYLKHLKIVAHRVRKLEQIPFLPIQFFKSKRVKTGSWTTEKEFMSSGTTSVERSSHLVKNISFYEHLTTINFEFFYGKLQDYAVIALLPSYQEQGNSSLIAMVDHFMQQSKCSQSGYVTVNDIQKKLEDVDQTSVRKILLVGVSYALLDTVIDEDLHIKNLVVMETGGMKGRKKELTRDALHDLLKKKFNTNGIHSEYGMTELLSQAYSFESGNFRCPTWMRVYIREMNDPFSQMAPGTTGGINVVDLGNIHTCAFIETKDIGRINHDGSFNVLGRFDNSDLRGCNLLMA